MTFDEICFSLPNGLHDAELQGFHMDYARRQLTFDLVLWIGDMENKSRREIRRPARVTVADVGFLIIEPPANPDALPLDGAVTIDVSEGLTERVAMMIPDVQAMGQPLTMFVVDWNSYIYFSAGDTSLVWTGEEEDWALR